MYRTAFAGAANVSAGTITSSSRCTPATTRARCNAAVPLVHATPCERPACPAISFSKRVTKSPADNTHPVSRHALMYVQALPPINGTDSGIQSAADGPPGSDAVFTGSEAFKIRLHPLDRQLQALVEAVLRRPSKGTRQARVGTQPFDFTARRPFTLNADDHLRRRRGQRDDARGEITDRDLAAGAKVH